MGSENVKTSFQTMRIIVSAGWSIYPLGYFFGYLQGSVKADQLNLIYNVADVINKIAFCLAIWHSAKKDPLRRASPSLHEPRFKIFRPWAQPGICTWSSF